jgi:hypothetical protein
VLEEDKGEMKEEKMKLADTYLALGDVSCETGKSTFWAPIDFKMIQDTGLMNRKLPTGSSRLLFGPLYPIQDSRFIIPYPRLYTLSTSDCP